MLTGNELYVVVKLVSGEQIMAVLKAEDENYIQIESPMTIRMITIPEENKEHITAHPYCHFSEESEFVLPKNQVMFVKKLHHMYIPHYIRLVSDHEKTQSQEDTEELSFDDEEDFVNRKDTIEEITKKIELLKSLLEDKQTYRYFVEGNDTIN